MNIVAALVAFASVMFWIGGYITARLVQHHQAAVKDKARNAFPRCDETVYAAGAPDWPTVRCGLTYLHGGTCMVRPADVFRLRAYTPPF